MIELDLHFFFFITVPLVPSDFNITREYHRAIYTIVTLGWDPIPQGNGPEAIVDNYTIYISPSPMYEDGIIMTDSPPLSVTLAHSVSYSVSIIASNCAGESDNQTIPIKIGKYYRETITGGLKV